jgi:hypothetical protein
MLSPFSSALAELDKSLQTVQIEIERLRGGLDPNEDLLHRSLATAYHYATMLGDLISAQRSNSNETDHQALDRLIHELNSLRRVERRRLKLLDLATELRAGRVRHHRVNRTEELNELRLQAARELQRMVTHPSQETDLPGPASGKWLHWACGLQEKTDGATLQALRRDFPAVEEFVAAIDERYWVSAEDHATEFSSAAAEGAAEEPAAEPPPAPAPRLIDTVPANPDRLARDLLAMFEKVLPPAQDLQAALNSDSPSGQATAVPRDFVKSDSEVASGGVGRTEAENRFLVQPRGRLNKEGIDNAARVDFMKVVKAWRLNDSQARRLLGISRALFNQIRDGERVTLEPDKLTRISLLVAISKGVNVLYGIRRGERWIYRPNSNPLFDGAAPLKYMLKQGVEGLVKVRELVGVWSGYAAPEEK